MSWEVGCLNRNTENAETAVTCEYHFRSSTNTAGELGKQTGTEIVATMESAHTRASEVSVSSNNSPSIKTQQSWRASSKKGNGVQLQGFGIHGSLKGKKY